MPTPPPLSPHPETTRRIVLLWIGRLGDLLVTTPLLGALRARFPQARIALVVGSKGREAAELIQSVDDIWTLGAACDLMAHGRLLRNLRVEPADLLIDLNSAYSKTSAFLARLARARVKLAFDTGRGIRAHTHLLPAAGEREPMAERYARMARALGAEIKDSTPRVNIRGQDLELARDLLRRLAAPARNPVGTARARERWLAIHPGNFKKFDNRWPEANFIELTDRLAAATDSAREPGFPGWRIVYLAGP
ncbi:MAG: glycosyltransferase family 9 protein, partial [Elusimicrobia bacterium]|nr:glycosyltransferase family 9 protein [Elusimicrobiota bacterium]